MAPVSAAARHIGTTLDEFLQEQGLYENAVESLLERLRAYAAAKQREHYAIALAKTYNRRRQAAYSEFIREYDSAKSRSLVTDDLEQQLCRQLERIKEFAK